MIIFLYGPDGYRLKENIDTIVGAYRKKYGNGVNYHCFDFDQKTGTKLAIANFVPMGNYSDNFFSAVKSNSLFDETRLIIVKNFFSMGSVFFSKLIALANGLGVADDKKTVLVFVENKTQNDLQKINKELFTFLNKKPNLIRNISYLKGPKLSDWAKSKFKGNGHNVSSAVVNLLISIVGNESWALANEIEKLSNYKKGGVITEKDVNLLVSRREDNNIFDLVDAVGNQNKFKAFEMIYCLANSGHDGHYLLSMLVYHFENLISVSDMLEGDKLLSPRSIAEKCNLHPFVARKAVNQAQKFSKEDLIKKFNQLASLDIASKNGQVDLRDALCNFTIV